MKIIDLSHTFTHEMPGNPDDPKASLGKIASLEIDSLNDHRLTTTMHIGTHLDAPFHMIAEGKKINEIPLERLIGPGILLDVRNKEVIDVDVLDNVVIPEGAILLLYTGFGDKYKTDAYFEGFPSVTEAFAEKLVKLKIKVLGVDMFGPDHSAPWGIHKILLANNVLLVESLAHMDQLGDAKNFEVMAIPPKLQADASPVRVFAILDSTN